MDIKKLSKLIEGAKETYFTDSSKFDEFMESQKTSFENYLNSGVQNNNNFLISNSSKKTSDFSNTNFNQNLTSNTSNFQTIPQVNPNLPQMNIEGKSQNFSTPINIVANNYISPNSLETGAEVDSIENKFEKKSIKLAKIPDNLLKSSATDWEPVNYNNVNQKYNLFGLSRVEINYDVQTQKLLYKIIEPELSDEEVLILEELKRGFIYVFEKFSPEFSDITGSDLIIKGSKKLCSKYKIRVTEEQLNKLTYYLERDFLGLEIIEPIMHDHFIEDVSCDGLNTPIFVNHLKYGPLEVNREFNDIQKLNSFIVKLAQKSNKEVSLSKPILQGALPDGSRMEAIYGKEVSEKGSSFTIRKFREEPFTPIHLIEFGTMPPLLLAYLWLSVENKQSILVSGGTATGKTTILNALSLFAPPTAKIVSIEDTPEINLPHEHWLPMISREGDEKSVVSMFDLLKASLRERPDYIIVGEIRGKEAAILFQGMATGHAGMGTVHAEKFGDLVNRMILDPINLPKQLLTELKIVLFQKQVKVKNNVVRRTFSIVEIIDYISNKDKFITNEFMRFNPQTDEFNFQEKSAVISNLINLRGGKEESLWNEIEKRRRILDFMHKNKILEFKDVSSIIKSYYKSPTTIFEVLEKFVKLRDSNEIKGEINN